MDVRFTKSGFNFAALSKNMRGNIAQELNSAAESAVSLAKQLAPVDTGFLKENITQTETASLEQLRSAIESGADYSAFVEYGTVVHDPQVFFTPSFESARRQLNNGLLRALK